MFTRFHVHLPVVHHHPFASVACWEDWNQHHISMKLLYPHVKDNQNRVYEIWQMKAYLQKDSYLLGLIFCETIPSSYGVFQIIMCCETTFIIRGTCEPGEKTPVFFFTHLMNKENSEKEKQ
uniref:Uncharacterized protein n=1 Tax=Glossina brevipalpis TaxID=37001 RepID=A0A1A9WIV6_9MUSC